MASSNEMMTPAEIEALLASMNAASEPPKTPAEPVTPEPAPAAANGMMSQDEIEAMLAAMNTEPAAAPEPVTPEPAPAAANGTMSQDEIEAMLAAMNPEPPAAPEPVTPEPIPAAANGMMSQDEIEAMLAAMNPEPPAAPEPVTPEPAPAAANGMMSQDEIEAMLAAMNPEPPAAPEPVTPEPAPAAANRMMSQDEIEAMLAAMNTEPAAAPEPVTPEPVPAAANGTMSQDEIEAMLAAMNPEPPAAPEPVTPEPAPAAANGMMSQDEIEAMLAAMNPEPTAAPEPVTPEPDLAESSNVAATASLPPDNPFITQAEIESILSTVDTVPTQPASENHLPAESLPTDPPALVEQQQTAADAAPPTPTPIPQAPLSEAAPTFLARIKNTWVNLVKKAAQLPLLNRLSKQSGAAAQITQADQPSDTLAAIKPTNPAKKNRLRKVLIGLGSTGLFSLIVVSAYLLSASPAASDPNVNPYQTKLAAMNIRYNPDEFVKYAGRGNKEAAELFLKAGMAPNSYRISDGVTPLMAAACFDRPDIVNLLLEQGADINAKDKDGQTALMKGIAYNHPGIVKILLQAGADPAYQDIRGNTAVSLAIGKKDPEILKLLSIATPANEKAASSMQNEKPPEKPALKEPPAEFALSGSKAGYMQVGQSLEAVYKQYNQKASAVVLDNAPAPVVKIYLDGRSTPSLTGSISIRKQGTVQLIDGIIIYDERFKTSKGMGIHSTLGDLRRANSFSEIRQIDQSLYAISSGIAFELAISLDQIADWLKTGNPNSLPDDIKIQSILMH